MKVHPVKIISLLGMLIIAIGLVVWLAATPRLESRRGTEGKQPATESFLICRMTEAEDQRADLLLSLAQKIEMELTASRELATPSQHRSLIEQFCAELDAEATQTVLAHLERLAPEALRSELMRALFLRLAELDPARAAELAGEHLRAWGIEADTEVIAEVRLVIAKHWAESNLLGTARWVQKWPDDSVRETVALWLVPLLEQSNPTVAGELILSLSDSPAKTEALDRLVMTWREHDFAGALAWVKELPTGEAQERSLLQLAHHWWQADAAAAWAFAQNLPEGQDRLAVLLVNLSMQNNPQATAQWVATLPDGVRKEKVVSSMTATWAEQEPRAAADYVVNLPAGTMQQEAAISVVSAWAGQDPAPAAAWVATFPEGHGREYAIENVAIRWAATDPAATVAWLEEHLTGRDRDMAIYAGAAGLMASHPDIATRWTTAIEDQTMRDYQMTRAVRHWLETEPDSARTWIAQSGLPSETKDSLLQSH